VCKMRRNELDEAENLMLEAYMLADSDHERAHVEANLDNLAQHLAFRAGEPIQGAKYRRRATKVGGTGDAQAAQAKPSGEKRWSPYDGDVTRPELLHQRPNPIGKPFPRKTKADLTKEGKAQGPFIFTDGMDEWKMTENFRGSGWSENLSKLFPKAVTDFYPYNMLSEERQSPYLTRLPKACKELMAPEEDFQFGKPKDGPAQVEGRYMHLQLTPKMWQTLEKEGHMPADRHDFLKNDDWLEACMDHPEGIVAEEWNLKTHWKIILIGSKGAGMFNHSDALMTSSWHAQVLGRKWWYVCGRLDNGQQVCYEDILKPGEILYYPRRWFHETQCLETPTMTITDTVAHVGNAAGIMGKTWGECSGRSPLKFDFSSQLCDALEECTAWWQRRVKKSGEHWSDEDRETWRDAASADHIAKLEKVKPEHNNYDGRNYITEE